MGEPRLVLSFVDRAKGFKEWLLWNNRYLHVRTKDAAVPKLYKNFRGLAELDTIPKGEQE